MTRKEYLKKENIKTNLKFLSNAKNYAFIFTEIKLTSVQPKCKVKLTTNESKKEQITKARSTKQKLNKTIT